MPEIPADLMVYILCQLPLKDLLRFRGVSKEWRDLIDSNKFIDSHLQHSLATNLNFFFGEQTTTQTTNHIGVVKHPITQHQIGIVKQSVMTEIIRSFPIIGSSNGLICLLSYTSGNYIPVLMNPSTRKHRMLPPVPNHLDNLELGCGFWYDSRNNDYYILSANTHSYAICSLSSNEWTVNNSFTDLVGLRHGVVLNGAWHWPGTREPGKGFIAVFDLLTRKYREVQAPDISGYGSVSFRVSGGCLWLGCVDIGKFIDLWVMEDYMVEGSWRRHSLAFCSQLYKDLNFTRVGILDSPKASTYLVFIELDSKNFRIDLRKQKALVSSFHYTGGLVIYPASLVKLPYGDQRS